MTRRTLRRTWLLGGLGLIGCGILGMLQFNGRPGSGAIQGIADVIFAVSILLFAVGLSRDDSVVSRRPLGMAALAIVAIWPLIAFAISRVMGPGVSPDDDAWMAYGYIALFVPAASGLIAAMQIARSSRVPAPWRWAPAWVLAAQALVWVISQTIFISVRPGDVQPFADLVQILGMLASIPGTLGLGILALILAAQVRPESVQVYHSS